MTAIKSYTAKLKCRVSFKGTDDNCICELTNGQWVKTCNNPDIRKVTILAYLCIFDQN